MAQRANETPDAEIENNLHSVMKDAVRDDVRRHLRALLETKHLYQSLKIEWSQLATEAKRLQDRGKEVNEYIQLGGERIWIPTEMQPYLKRYATKVSSSKWFLIPELQAPGNHPTNSTDLDIIAPPAELFCRVCKTTKTHNSGSLTIETLCPPYPIGKIADQVFTCGYECQSCRTAPIVFQITRRGEKLTLTGSSEYPTVSIAREIPDEIAEYISEAMLAAGTGRTLAGLFFLRTALEQHMRHSTKLTGRQSGDELATAYFKLLSDEFPKRDWILGRVYEELSSKLHMAEADEKQFEKSLNELVRFFSVLKLYPLVQNPSSS